MYPEFINRHAMAIPQPNAAAPRSKTFSCCALGISSRYLQFAIPEELDLITQFGRSLKLVLASRGSHLAFKPLYRRGNILG
jgi:hypothetical protein